MSYRKKPHEITLMRQAGELLWQAHQVAAKMVCPGVTTAELDMAVESFLLDNGAQPLFKGVPGVVPFPATACISINEEVVHGIPSPRSLEEGDIVSIDLGCRLQGWCADAAITHAVGVISEDKKRLLKATEGALHLALSMMRPGVWWNTIALRMDRYVAQAGCTMVRSPICGHGIGQELWESPSVPNIKTRRDFRLDAGMVIAVEPMVTLGSPYVRELPDHWTLVSEDNSAAAHFEHTIVITEEGAQVLTAGPQGQGWAIE
jgi:methionyl aminopeptidase